MYWIAYSSKKEKKERLRFASEPRDDGMNTWGHVFILIMKLGAKATNPTPLGLGRPIMSLGYPF